MNAQAPGGPPKPSTIWACRSCLPFLDQQSKPKLMQLCLFKSFKLRPKKFQGWALCKVWGTQTGCGGRRLLASSSSSSPAFSAGLWRGFHTLGSSFYSPVRRFRAEKLIKGKPLLPLRGNEAVGREETEQQEDFEVSARWGRVGAVIQRSGVQRVPVGVIICYFSEASSRKKKRSENRLNVKLLQFLIEFWFPHAT